MEYIKQLNSQGKQVARIRTDNGNEFKANIFASFCSENGMVHEFTCSYTPQKDGVSERLNRTLMDKVRSRFEDTNLSKYLWGEAIRCAVFQLNRSPTRALRVKVPAQIFLGKLNLEKLIIFGSKAGACTLPRGDKLELRARECRIEGYSGSGYKLWDPITDEIIISRDARINEKDYNLSSNNSIDENKNDQIEDESRKKTLFKKKMKKKKKEEKENKT